MAFVPGSASRRVLDIVGAHSLIYLTRDTWQSPAGQMPTVHTVLTDLHIVRYYLHTNIYARMHIYYSVIAIACLYRPLKEECTPARPGCVSFLPQFKKGWVRSVRHNPPAPRHPPTLLLGVVVWRPHVLHNMPSDPTTTGQYRGYAAQRQATRRLASRTSGPAPRYCV